MHAVVHEAFHELIHARFVDGYAVGQQRRRHGYDNAGDLGPVHQPSSSCLDTNDSESDALAFGCLLQRGCLRPLSRPACGASLLTLRGSSAEGPETWKWTSAGFAQAEISPMAEGYLWVRNVEVIIGEAQVECQLVAASRVRPRLLPEY